VSAANPGESRNRKDHEPAERVTADFETGSVQELPLRVTQYLSAKPVGRLPLRGLFRSDRFIFL